MDRKAELLIAATLVMAVLIAHFKESHSWLSTGLNVLVVLGYAWSFRQSNPVWRWGGIFLVALLTAVVSGLLFNPAGLTPLPALLQAGVITLLLGTVAHWAWRRQDVRLGY